MSPKKALPFALDTSSEIPKFRAETFWTKEPETIQWIDDNLSFKSKTDLFIDVGANIGIYSLYAAEVNCAVPVFAIEPVSTTYDELLRNIASNQREEQILGFCVALSHQMGFGKLINLDSRLGSSGAQIEYISNPDTGHTVIKSGDQLLEEVSSEKNLDLQNIMLKVDTDGNELDVLRGFSLSFENRKILTVLVETHPSNRDGIDEFLTSRGLREDLTYLNVEGHSNIRRESKGNRERTKIYSR